MTAKVIPILRPRTCDLCQHFDPIEDGQGLVSMWCREWGDEINSVADARECPDFVRADTEPIISVPQTTTGGMS